MIASSNSAKLVAVSAAVMLHGVAVFALAGRETVEIEAGAGPVDVAFGASFADMSAGAMTAKPTETPLEPVEPEAEAAPTKAIEPDETPGAQPARAEPMAAPETLRPVIARAPKSAQPSEIVAADPARAALRPIPVEPALPVEQAAPSPQEPPAARPASAPPVEESEAAGENPSAVTRSLRPKTRTRVFEQAHESGPAKRTQKKPAKTQRKAAAQPKGNANSNARAGSSSGSKSAKAATGSSGRNQKQKAKGNAKASNYPGQVMRKIARVSKPRVGAKGSAIVAFTIAPSGGLSAVSIARSSGSSQLDRAALNVIRKAAPFPPPPAGARRSFSIKIKGG